MAVEAVALGELINGFGIDGDEAVLRWTMRYAPVYGLSKILNYALTKFKSIAITAVPCHAKATRRVFESRGRDGDVFIVGLYCNNTLSMLATKYALKYFNINVEGVKSVRVGGRGVAGPAIPL